MLLSVILIADSDVFECASIFSKAAFEKNPTSAVCEEKTCAEHVIELNNNINRVDKFFIVRVLKRNNNKFYTNILKIN